jgi:8-oxoguanine deaminase
LQFSGAQDPLAALIICGAHRADRVMVNGRWRVIDGDLVQFDLDRARRTHQQLARTLQTAIHS